MGRGREPPAVTSNPGRDLWLEHYASLPDSIKKDQTALSMAMDPSRLWFLRYPEQNPAREAFLIAENARQRGPPPSVKGPPSYTQTTGKWATDRPTTDLPPPNYDDMSWADWLKTLVDELNSGVEGTVAHTATTIFSRASKRKKGTLL